MEQMQLLEQGLYKLGLDLAFGQKEQFLCYRDELLAWNQRVNLTTITEPKEIGRLHFLDSLTLALAPPDLGQPGARLCDVGSGAGFPGVPLKIAFPSLKVTLIDSTTKRTDFLRHIVASLGLEGVQVLTGRAEDLARTPGLREAFDVVVARAVADLAALLEYTLPFCKIDGRVVLPKKGDMRAELDHAREALEQLGGASLEVVPVPDEVLGGQRVLVVARKARATPEGYPRRAGVPSKRPL